jgi:hypothetical protein
VKIVHEEVLIDEGGFRQTPEYHKAHQDIIEAIAKIVWPPGNDRFVIHPSSRGNRHPNGVVPIKAALQDHLRDCGWSIETTVDVGVTRRQPGPIDATITIEGKYFALEWETGNISSSHRALNKLAIGLSRGILVGGVLIVPSNNLYPHLTDRIGNFRELEPYLDLYRVVKCDYGVLCVMVVEHDAVSEDVPPIPKGLDGMSLSRRQKA